MSGINLEKNERFELDKGLSLINVNLGWTPNDSGSTYDFDLDASAFMLGNNGKLVADEFFVFYNNQKSPDGAVESSGDDLTGDDGETLTVDLPRVDQRVQEILFTVTIYKAQERQQNFGQVRDAFISIVDKTTNKEIARYDLNEDFSTETAVVFGKLYRSGRIWHFEAIGDGNQNGLEGLVRTYQ